MIDTKPYNIMSHPVIVKYPGAGGGGGGGLIKLEIFVTKDLSPSIVGNFVVFKGFFLPINLIICEVNLLSVRFVKSVLSNVQLRFDGKSTF